MDESCSSKKRKKSFANDRLKALRTTINNDVISPPSTNKLDINLPSKDSSNNQEYLQRKKLKATRKLKNNDVTVRPDFLDQFNRASTHIDHEDFSDGLPSKRRKIDVFKTDSKIPGSISDLNSHKKSRGEENCQVKIKESERPQSRRNSTISERLKRNSQSIKSQIQSSFDYTPHLVNSVNGIKNKSVVSKMDSPSINFSDLCSTKKSFEYSHRSQEETTENSTFLNSSSLNSKNYSEYFEKSVNALYCRLFKSQGNHKKGISQSEFNMDTMDWEPDRDITKDSGSCESIQGEMYIIVDTNIFLDSLSFLEGIVKYGSEGGIKSVIYVPWMVFNELDYLKDNKYSLKSSATKAIDFINKMLSEKGGKLIGQSIFEANSQMYVGKSPDDKITSCCLQVKEKGLNVVLLSNDKNLRNKLIVNGIPSFSCSEFLNNFDNSPPHVDKLNVLFKEMEKCCTSIIIDCCEEAYGSVWNKLALLEKNPWDFKMCLEIFKKYWVAVFKDKLLKQFLPKVEKMIQVLKNPGTLKNPSSFESFVEDCLSLCFYLMDLEEHKDLVGKTQEKLNAMVDPKSL